MSSRADAIADTLTAVRERTFRLYEPLAEADLGRTPDTIMSPPIWDLGHIAAYEELWLLCTLAGVASRHPDLQRAYDAFETPRHRRTEIELLDAAGCRAYLSEVRERAFDVLAAADLDPDGPPLTADGFVFEMVAQHEAQHSETVLQTLQMFADGTYRPTRDGDLPVPPDAVNGRCEVPGGEAWMGAARGRFAYDCERPRHRLELAPFLIDRYPVTVERHLAFMADGGYERPELWSPEGWEWRSANDIVAPLYWRREAGEWLARSFDRLEPVAPGRPVSHVSWYEADAHARWAGARLPSEAEWERAAANGVCTYPWGDAGPHGRANLDQLSFGPAAVGAFPDGQAPSGAAQMIGDVWEWTSSTFAPYPGFVAFPYAEYAEVFFDGRFRVLRGGSWATQPVAARTSFRNWDLPQRRQIFSGFRLAWDPV